MSEPAQGIAGYLNPAEMHKLGRLLLHSRYVVEGNLAGAHRSPLKGPSSEFADHKAYGIGDDPKHIDWRVVARTDKYYVKRYEDETNLRVYLTLDRSASMNFSSGEVTKYDMACRLAAALGYVVVKSRDSVGLYLASEKVDVRVETGNSFNHLNNMLKQVQGLGPGKDTGVAAALHEVAATIRNRALVVVISDLLDDEEELTLALARLRKDHHDVIVFHTLDPMELDLSYKKPMELEDLESGERLVVNPKAMADAYREAFGAFLERCQNMCASMKIDYRLTRTDQSVESFVRAYLDRRRRSSR